MNNEEQKLTAAEYFEEVKGLKHECTDEGLNNFYDACLVVLSKYMKTGQNRMVDKIRFIIDTIPKERELVKKGINIFIYKDDIENFINDVEDKVVKIIEMKNFPREIPDELVDVIDETRDIFDEFYILFTDYTGEEERRVEKERREKDPILFGVFKENNKLYDRFYYLGDWVDEYCDLTLEKLLSMKGEEIVKSVRTPINKDELLEELSKLKENDSNNTWRYTNSGNITMERIYVSSNEDNSEDKEEETQSDTKKSNGILSTISRGLKSWIRK